MMRSFLAVAPDARCQHFLEQEIARLRAALPQVPVRWTADENLHLTLHFLGNITPALAQQLVQRLPAALSARRAFDAPLRETTLFPGAQRPRALAVTIARMPALSGLVSTLRRTAQQSGARVERQRFRGHITLGRLHNSGHSSRRKERGKEAQHNADLMEIGGSAPAPPLRVAELVLFESQLRPEGPRYIPLENFALQP